HADHESEMRRRVTAKLADGGQGLTVAEIRDLLGTTRKYAVPLCEYLDKVGVTRRDGDRRVLAAAETARPVYMAAGPGRMTAETITGYPTAGEDSHTVADFSLHDFFHKMPDVPFITFI